MDVFYTHKPHSGNPNFYGWENVKIVHDTLTNDQFVPGIDFNTAGNVAVTYFDRRNTNNVNYEQYMSYVFTNGDRIHPDVVVSPAVSDPTLLPDFDGNLAGHQAFIADYQEVWIDNYPQGERGISAWIRVLGNNWTDLFLSEIFF